MESHGGGGQWSDEVREGGSKFGCERERESDRGGSCQTQENGSQS